MRARSLLTVVGAALGSAAGVVLLRRRTARRERIELYFEDGSLVALTQGSDDAEPLLVHARELLAAARN
jgi:hypothetical protein